MQKRGGKTVFCALVVGCVCVAVWGATVRYAASHPVHPGATVSVKTDADAARFLKKFGWDAAIPAMERTEVTLPETFDEVYRRYNRMQQATGMDLMPYRGKTVERRTYALKTRDSSAGELRANLLLYENRVIAGDIMSVGVAGAMYSLVGNAASY